MVSNLLGLKKEKEKEKTEAVTISPQYSVLFFFLGRKIIQLPLSVFIARISINIPVQPVIVQPVKHW